MAVVTNKSDLTRRQLEVLWFIDEHIYEYGYPPTVREMGAHFGINSPNGILNHLVALTRKGYIRRRSLSRAITILKPIPRDTMTVEIRITCSRCGVKLADDRIVYQVRSGSLRHPKPAVDFCEPCYAAFQSWLAKSNPQNRIPLPGQRELFEAAIWEANEKF